MHLHKIHCYYITEICGGGAFTSFNRTTELEFKIAVISHMHGRFPPFIRNLSDKYIALSSYMSANSWSPSSYQNTVQTLLAIPSKKKHHKQELSLLP